MGAYFFKRDKGWGGGLFEFFFKALFLSMFLRQNANIDPKVPQKRYLNDVKALRNFVKQFWKMKLEGVGAYSREGLIRGDTV